MRLAHVAEEFGGTLPGTAAEYRQTGSGDDVTSVRLWRQPDIATGWIRFGFPMLGSLDVADDAIVFGLALTTPPGSRWEGIDLEPGTVTMASAGGHHQAVDVIGMEVGLIVLGLDDVKAAMEDLGRNPAVPQRALLDPARARRITRAFLSDPAASSRYRLISDIAVALSDAPDSRGSTSWRRVSSMEITQLALDHVRTSGTWMPSSLELCRALGVSERRLQTAFREIYDTPPSRFFRLRALSEARSRLASSPTSRAPVTRTARELGFTHLSHFARYYQHLFGESPSETLADARRSG